MKRVMLVMPVIVTAMSVASPVMASPIVFTAGAQYQYSVAAGAGTGRSSGIQTLGPFELPLYNLVIDDAVAHANGAASSISLRGTVTPGVLQASAQTVADVRTAPVNASASAVASAAVGFSDFLTFQSAALAPGTPVLYSIEYVLDATFGMAFQTSPYRSGGSPVPFGGYVTLTNHSNVFMTRELCGGAGAEHQSTTRTFNAQVGQTVQILESLSVHSMATACTTFLGCGADLSNPRDPYQNQLVDATHTGLLFVTLNTPGVTFTSASGATYAPQQSPSPVPEPASFLLVGTGLAWFARRRFARRSGDVR